jgi:hypothetical protein
MTQSGDMDRAFERMFSDFAQAEDQAPSSLKARLYSAFVREQQASGSLASLDFSVAAGHGICVFEKLVQIAPIGEKAKSPFFCAVCHARVLAENLENPPIFWPNCPYVAFKNS